MVSAPSRPPQFSVDKAKIWIQSCLADHGALCGEDGGQARIAVRGMKVIDCETLMIIPATANTRWVALSYVWRLAVPDIPITNILPPPTEPNSLRLPDLIPALIVDAMTVVKNLGYRYLWVDRYCINQDDKDEVRDQIAQMDRIYRGADFTIIAAGDSNGLAGVGGNTKRPNLDVFNFNATTTLYETDPNPIAEIRRSPWFTRGWTFQEAILSRRRLFFTNSQALFECTTSTWCE
ncbi:heterokaryon incompatibility protein-domain-containing protein, partial [Lasiosphaeris hirsuta]